MQSHKFTTVLFPSYGGMIIFQKDTTSRTSCSRHRRRRLYLTMVGIQTMKGRSRVDGRRIILSSHQHGAKDSFVFSKLVGRQQARNGSLIESSLVLFFSYSERCIQEKLVGVVRVCVKTTVGTTHELHRNFWPPGPFQRRKEKHVLFMVLVIGIDDQLMPILIRFQIESL